MTTTTDKIARTLKQLRHDKAMTVNDVVERLGDESVNIAVKTLYGWESGQALPRLDVFLALCQVYDVRDIRIFS